MLVGNMGSYFRCYIHPLDDLVFYVNLIYSQRTQELAATYDRF